jgi:predicted  nucleic acid-binding Zn-ribbon protein
MAVAAQLFRLEQLDADIEQHEAALADLQRRQQTNPELQSAEEKLRRLRAEEATVSAEQRSLESDLGDLAARIKRDNARMYSGQIVDARELASLERELAHYRTQNDGLEERILELMERLETLQVEVQSQDHTVAELRESWESSRPDVERRRQRLGSEVVALRGERDALAGTLDPRSLSMYDRLRASSGHAVSSVSNGVCQWCRVTLPPKDVQHARSTLVTCNNCARILYIGV